MSHIVATGILPEPIRKDAASYVGCVAGAMPRDEYLRLINEAGFAAIEVAETKSIDLPDEMLAPHWDAARLAAFRSSENTLQSINRASHESCLSAFTWCSAA